MRPSMRSRVNTGSNAAAMIAMAKNAGRATSIAAWLIQRNSSPRFCGRCFAKACKTFSARTTLLSTRIPKSMAPMEMRLAGRPSSRRPK